MALLNLRNPHSVLAALEKRPQDVLEILVPVGLMERASGKDSDPGLGRDAWLKVVQFAQSRGVKVKTAPSVGARSGGQQGARTQNSRGKLIEGAASDPGRTGGTEAVVKERQGVPVEELFRNAKNRAGGKGLWLALDCLTDPQNVGAIFRSASFFGVQGILLTQERSAPLTSTVYDVATGGLEYVPFTIQPNLQRAFEVAKEAGLWTLGASEHAQQSFREVERDRPWLLVLGNEEKGMRRLTEEACDVVCQVPPQGGVTSLNVSVAAGVLISALSN
jgi:23S rRNA (guanosine2251-2'-O)-methyltransferase